MDIAITEVKEVPERFHAQLNATSKTYLYRMTITDVPSVFDRKHAYHCFKVPDKTLMQHAALAFIGKHDFGCFSDGKTSKPTVHEEEMQILIHADDFLHNMARTIIGTLLDVGFGIRKKEDVEEIFAGTKEPSQPCDPRGLYLQKITYGKR